MMTIMNGDNGMMIMMRNLVEIIRIHQMVW